MNRQNLIDQIKAKKSFLCVGLDTDPQKLPQSLKEDKDGILKFNKAIIDATKNHCVAYKINTAFYEALGIDGWRIMEETLKYIPENIFTIADAKRGDIGNTANQYAKTFFETYPFDSVTIAPYMGKDSVAPFLQYKDKWGIVLGVTSNEGSKDFQMNLIDGKPLYEIVMKKVSEWGTPDNLMFVVGATRNEQLARIREIVPNHFLLIPGVGAQGATVKDVAEHALNKDFGILINVSRGIIYASQNEDFKEVAEAKAIDYKREMEPYFSK